MRMNLLLCCLRALVLPLLSIIIYNMFTCFEDYIFRIQCIRIADCDQHLVQDACSTSDNKYFIIETPKHIDIFVISIIAQAGPKAKKVGACGRHAPEIESLVAFAEERHGGDDGNAEGEGDIDGSPTQRAAMSQCIMLTQAEACMQ